MSDNPGNWDARFPVSNRHRVLFGSDVLAADAQLLAGVFPAEEAPRSCLVFLDTGLVDAQPELPDRFDRWCASHADRVVSRRAPVQVVGGESAKNDIAVLQDVLAAMEQAHLCRQSFVIVAGGGAVLDVVGFAAAITHRGVRLVRMPSTTLSQADSGIGVKTGINAFGKKNFLGTFGAPWAVVNDATLLASLRDADWRCGFAEAVKVALIKDAAFFDVIERDASAIACRDMAAAWPIIRRSAELHFQHIVAGGDPFETAGAKPLDFGHWSAHKLEQMTSYAIRHGEAVAIGIALDVAWSVERGMLAPEAMERTCTCLETIGFSLWHPALRHYDELLAGLDEFREHLGGPLSTTLLASIGQGVEVAGVDRDDVMRAVAGLEARAVSLGRAG